MLKTEKIERLIELCLASGYIKDGTAPLSLFLIANAESGKTKMIENIICPHTIITSDLSSKSITEVIIPALEKEELHHILIPDLIKVLAHKSITVQSTMSFINALIEEGIKQQLFFGQNFSMKEKRKCGIITSMTPEYFVKSFRLFNDMGLNTRVLPCSFIYNQETISNIHKAISENNFFEETKIMKKITKRKIDIPEKVGNEINFLVNKILEKQKYDNIVIRVKGGKQKRVPIKLYGFRLHRQLRKLLQSITLIDGRKVVEYKDLNELMELIDYIRLPKNPKEI